MLPDGVSPVCRGRGPLVCLRQPGHGAGEEDGHVDEKYLQSERRR